MRGVARLEQRPRRPEPEVLTGVAHVHPHAPLVGGDELRDHLAGAVQRPAAPAVGVGHDVPRAQRVERIGRADRAGVGEAPEVDHAGQLPGHLLRRFEER